MFHDGINALKKLPLKKLCRWPMRELTSFRIGGMADIILFPENTQELLKVFLIASEWGVPIYPLGGGTNLLVKDGGVRGAIVCLSSGFNYISMETDEEGGGVVLRAGAGANMGRVCLFAIQHGLEGLEELLGIPGSLGGWLTMNAGANSVNIGEKVNAVRMLAEDGQWVSFPRGEIGFGYRRAQYPVKGIIVEAMLALKEGDAWALRKKARDAVGRRLSSRRVLPFNAGSIFKNPPGYSAGALIEQCGLKGECEGDAQISQFHGNIIVNRGRATASDVLRLVERAREKVLARSGIELKEEIVVLGE